MTTRYYSVAGLRFSFTLPDSEKLWTMLEENYSPFEVEASCDDTPLLFSLVYSEEPPCCDKGEKVYKSEETPGETLLELYRCADGGWYFESAPDYRMKLASKVKVDKDFSKAVFTLCDKTLSTAHFAINNAAMVLFAFSAARYGALEMHSSVIKNAGKAYLFLGKSGDGKSTHSRQWLEHIEGSVLLNDDNPILRVDPQSGETFIYGSPWSGKTKCYINDSAPAGAMVRIIKAPENKATRLPLIESYAILFSSCSGLKVDRENADLIYATMEKVLEKVPFYSLECTPDRRAAEVCKDAVMK